MRSGPAAIAGLLLGLALIMPSCGGEQTATAGKATADPGAGAVGKRSRANAEGQTGPARCGKPLGDFLDSIESLDNTLAVGLSYEDYLGAVNDVRSTYAAIPADRLPLGCLVLVGGPAERALNVYIEAANLWGDCLTTASCSSLAVEPKLQRRWAEAAGLIAKTQRGMHGLG
jgi:hypothetical protein